MMAAEIADCRAELPLLEELVWEVVEVVLTWGLLRSVEEDGGGGREDRR